MLFENILFFLSAAITICGAIGVVFSKNLMHACVYLLGCLFGVAGLYATLGADFIAATQLVVYAGGVVILMLFAIMLTGGTENKTNKFGIEKVAGMGNMKTYIFGIFTALVVSFVLLKLISGFLKDYTQAELPPFTATVERIGTLLITDHVLAFEISSILLLGALVGAAVISRPRKD